MRILLAMAVLLAPLPIAAQSTPGRTITKSEIRSVDPRRTHRRLRDVIWDMFEREDLRSNTSPRHALTDLWLRTRPRGTEIPGLCRYDGVAVEFAPTSRGERGADTPVRAVGLRASTFFRFIAPPTVLYHEVGDREPLPTEGDCRTLDPDGLAFFRSTDARVALDGYLAFLALQNTLRGDRAAPLDCDLNPRERDNCRDLILSFGETDIREIEVCQPNESREQCFRIWADDRRIDVIVTGRVIPGPPPGQVIRARLASLIILSHPRPD